MQNEQFRKDERAIRIADMVQIDILWRIGAILFSGFLGIVFVNRYHMLGRGYVGITDLLLGIAGILSSIVVGFPICQDFILYRKVKIINAVAHIVQGKQKNGGGSTWYLDMGNHDYIFEVDYKIAERLEDGECYRIEYLPFSRIIIRTEKITRCSEGSSS